MSSNTTPYIIRTKQNIHRQYFRARDHHRAAATTTFARASTRAPPVGLRLEPHAFDTNPARARAYRCGVTRQSRHGAWLFSLVDRPRASCVAMCARAGVSSAVRAPVSKFLHWWRQTPPSMAASRRAAPHSATSRRARARRRAIARIIAHYFKPLAHRGVR